MKKFTLTTKPIIFLGISDYLNVSSQPFPIGHIDLFGFNHHKSHIVYPGQIKSNAWWFLVSYEFCKKIGLDNLKISIFDEDKNMLGSTNFSSIRSQIVGDNNPPLEVKNQNGNNEVTKENPLETQNIIISKTIGYGLIGFQLDGMVNHPGEFTIKSEYGDNEDIVGRVRFHYKPSPPLTPDQIQAIYSDPNSVKIILLTYNCKECNDNFKVYTGLKRDSKLELDGCIWYADLEDNYKCGCGKFDISLKYLRESMHGLLLIDLVTNTKELKFTRQYRRQQINKIAQKFNKLIRTEKLEPPIQKFLEENLLLLSRFHAKRIFIKPGILGKFVTDFAVINSDNELILIEIERPSIKLFKKDNHPTADLMHAFNQVNDWLVEYSDNPSAVLKSLNLQNEKIVSVKGAVIAGTKDSLQFDVLHRFLIKPPFSDISFMTLDDLSNSLIQLSKDIA